MFEENKNNIDEFDLSFRSVLEEAQEQVPAHVWDGIEGELDRISQRRVAVLWFRRAAVGAAAAAAVTLGMFFGRGTDAGLVAPASDSSMIAVAETPAEVLRDAPEEAVGKLMAMVEKTSVGKTPAGKAETGMTEKAEAAEAAETETVATESVAAGSVAAGETRQEHESSAKPETDRATAKNDAADGRFPDVWPEDRPQRKKTGTSIVISGITGTNSAQNSHRVNPMKRPAVSAAPKKTGIKETSTNTIYGVPVSAGLGVKIDFNPEWSLGVGLNYTLLTRKFYGNYTRVGADGSILKDVSSDIRNSQHYIGIPVNVYYNIVNQDKINFYAYAGGTAEKCLADKYQVLNTEITHAEKVKGVQLSAGLGLGVEFMLGRHLGLYIDPSLRYYFNCAQPKSIRTAQPLTAGFEIGFRARL